MTTIEEQAHLADAETHAAVEAQMGKILIELGGALGVLLTALGTRSGLWSALAGAGPVTVDQVAAKVTVDRVLVREWLRAAERDTVIHTLATAAGLGGRRRRLGDQSERARKTVSARVRDAVSKIDHVHPALADHLRGALRMGTVCSYAPREPTIWNLK